MATDCFRSYNLPVERTWDSYRFEVRDIWAVGVVDAHVTDSEEARDRLIAHALREGYDVCVISRSGLCETTEFFENTSESATGKRDEAVADNINQEESS